MTNCGTFALPEGLFRRRHSPPLGELLAPEQRGRGSVPCYNLQAIKVFRTRQSALRTEAFLVTSIVLSLYKILKRNSH